MTRHVDYPLLIITLILLAAGLLIIYSVSVDLSRKNFGTPYYYLLRQSIAALVGLGGLWVGSLLPYKKWKKLALPLLLVSLLLVSAVFIPDLGFTFGGASRWLRAGPLSIQPSEILKLSLILYLASWLDRKKGQAKGFTSAFIPFLVVIGMVGILLVMQPDIGTLVTIGGSAAILYFLGGGRLLQLLTLVVLAAVALTAIIRVVPYRMARFLVFLNPNLDPQGIGYHASQALIAIGSGGFLGRGFGQSIQKFGYLPEPIGYSVFAV
ncbi:MAG: FtsW/RodA/SpoVE family cell cycle protein, partial [Patescibacteria group bacterium]